MKDIFDISGKSIIVSGATGVLAGALARYFSECGARVAYLGRSEEKLREAVFGVENCMTCVCDVLDEDSLISARDAVLAKFGGIDVLVNGAGGNLPGAVVPPDKSVFDLDFSQWKDVVDLNLRGVLLPTLVFAKEFEKSKKGVVLNFSSMTAQSAITRVLGYSNAKAAVDNLTKWLAVEFAKKIGEGVRVNAIAPGFFISAQNKKLLTNDDGSYTQRGSDVIAKTPFARFGKPDEIFGAARFLVSDASKFVSGVVLPVDGGFSCFSGV